MIQQIAPISHPARTGLNKGLVQARHIQARLKDEYLAKPKTGYILNPMTAHPHVVPILRWID